MIFKFLSDFESQINSDIVKKYKFANSFEFEVIYSEKVYYNNHISDEKHYNEDDDNLEFNISSRTQSENYYLYEKIDVKSAHGKSSKKEILAKIQNGNFVPINMKSGNDISSINRHCNNFILELDRMKQVISRYESAKSINELF